MRKLRTFIAESRLYFTGASVGGLLHISRSAALIAAIIGFVGMVLAAMDL